MNRSKVCFHSDGEYIYKQVRTVQEKDQYLSVQTIVYNLLFKRVWVCDVISTIDRPDGKNTAGQNNNRRLIPLTSLPMHASSLSEPRPCIPYSSHSPRHTVLVTQFSYNALRHSYLVIASVRCQVHVWTPHSFIHSFIQHHAHGSRKVWCRRRRRSG